MSSNEPTSASGLTCICGKEKQDNSKYNNNAIYDDTPLYNQTPGVLYRNSQGNFIIWNVNAMFTILYPDNSFHWCYDERYTSNKTGVVLSSTYKHCEPAYDIILKRVYGEEWEKYKRYV